MYENGHLKQLGGHLGQDETTPNLTSTGRSMKGADKRDDFETNSGNIMTNICRKSCTIQFTISAHAERCETTVEQHRVVLAFLLQVNKKHNPDKFSCFFLCLASAIVLQYLLHWLALLAC